MTNDERSLAVNIWIIITTAPTTTDCCMQYQKHALIQSFLYFPLSFWYLQKQHCRSEHPQKIWLPERYGNSYNFQYLKSEIENHDKTKEMSAGSRLFRFEFNSWPGHQPYPSQSALSSSVDKQPSVEINKSINVSFHTSLIKSGPFILTYAVPIIPINVCRKNVNINDVQTSRT